MESSSKKEEMEWKSGQVDELRRRRRRRQEEEEEEEEEKRSGGARKTEREGQ